MSLPKSYVLVMGCILLLLAGCATEGKKISEVQQDERGLLPKRESVTDNSPEWGLALSGGGTRAASFDIGVLQALEGEEDKRNWLSQLDYISSVSGGSYASYWFYSQNYYSELIKQYLQKDNQDKEKDSQDKKEAKPLLRYPTTQAPFVPNVYEKLASCGKTGVDGSTKVEGFTEADIFKDKNRSRLAAPVSEYRFQDHLENNDYILNHSHSKFGHAFEDAGHVLGQLFTIPINWVTQGIFDWDEATNLSVAKIAYRHGLERTYGLVPCATNDGLVYANDLPGYVFWFDKAVQAEDLTFEDLSNLLKKRNSSAVSEEYLPMPIINTTKGNFGNVDENLSKSVFAFTPSAYGTAQESYQSKAPLKFSEAVAASGAAVDAQKPGTPNLTGFGLFLIDGNLGYKIPNPKVSTVHRMFHYILPYPLYRAEYAVSPPFLHLSDGGHSDNLGVYSLVERHVKNIIVVDGEHDPEYVFMLLSILH